MSTSRLGSVRAGDVVKAHSEIRSGLTRRVTLADEADELCLSVTLHHNQLARAKSAFYG